LFEAVDLRDVRMIERGQRPCLALKARHTVGVSGDGVGQNLQRDVAFELGIACPIDLTHPAGPERADHLVDAQSGSGS
jgi:hypothetical protein